MPREQCAELLVTERTAAVVIELGDKSATVVSLVVLGVDILRVPRHATRAHSIRRKTSSKRVASRPAGVWRRRSAGDARAISAAESVAPPVTHCGRSSRMWRDAAEAPGDVTNRHECSVVAHISSHARIS